jgi:urease accessory protein
MNALLLLLLDSRAPAGAHNHSAGMEAAVGTGLVSDLASLEDFCRVRLATSGRVAAAFAAAACQLQADSSERCIPTAVAERQSRATERALPHAPVPAAGGALADEIAPDVPAPVAGSRNGAWLPPRQAAGGGAPAAGRRALARSRSEEWALLDAELDARIPSEAARAASRQLGGGLRRLLRSMLPGAELESAWALCGAGPPHHPLVLGAGVALAGGTPQLAARAAALAACAGPASAAVRLLGLDPFAVQAMLARLAPRIDTLAECAAAVSLESLPCDSAPALDLLADVHLTAEVRLFAS